MLTPAATILAILSLNSLLSLHNANQFLYHIQPQSPSHFYIPYGAHSLPKPAMDFRRFEDESKKVVASQAMAAVADVANTAVSALSQAPPPTYQAPPPTHQRMSMDPIPIPANQAPIIVPARAVYEPVIHDHPDPSVIKRIVGRGRDKKRRGNKWRYAFSSDEDYSMNTDVSSSDSVSAEYYEDVLRFKGLRH